MGTLKAPGGFSSLSHTLCVLLLMFLGRFTRGQGPGQDSNVQLYVVEERGAGVVVGTLPFRSGYSYTMESSPLFEVDSGGVLRTKTRIDREALASDSVVLYLEGTHATQPFHALEVTVHVLDINDNAPRFDQAVVSEAFQEDAQDGQQQLIITAVDPDNGLNGTVTQYEIVSGNEDGKFRLNPPSDQTPFMFVVTQGGLDRETKDFYQLNISARDGGDIPLYGYLQLNIDITDINDNPPSFHPSDYVAEVREGADVGTSVIRVEASDDDIGDNAEIYYSVVDQSGQFRIESRTGIIRTLTSPIQCSRPSCGRQRSLDSIECDPNSCLLTVESRDGGRTPQSGRAYVSVTVIDENDHDPIITFLPTNPDPVTGTATIDEDARGVRVASISVSDADRGVNGQTSVQIISGNGADHFRLVSLTIQSTTINYIQVKGSLDRETIPNYNLTVRAVDKGSPPRSSTAFLIITVNDANDHAPVFEHSTYSTSMTELAMPGSFVASVKAQDEDSGPNSQLIYTIVAGNDDHWFVIDDTTGLVTTRMTLDYETSSQVTLNISASDGTYSNFTQLIVTILDENDMAPRFVDSNNQDLDVGQVIFVDMEENKPVNELIVMVTAVDQDSGVNGTVSYLIHPDTQLVHPDLFQVGVSSGRVSTRLSLDREERSIYTIWVIARDGGSPSLSSTATVHLTITDTNDNVPQFQPDTYFVNVFETDPAGVKVVQVNAKDDDAGLFGHVTYNFSGSVYNSFSIDADTGLISTITVLRRSVGRSYRLSVVAVDGGGRRSDQDAMVNVIVARIDDLAPRFPAPSVTFSIAEDSGRQLSNLDRTVGKVQASDVIGSTLTYAISTGDPLQVFSIDNTGMIRRDKVVDREEMEKYNLMVIATTGSKFGQVRVVIQVTDLNDNSPHFTATHPHTTLMENWPAGNNIFLAGAEDADADQNSLLVYTLQSQDDPDHVFIIDQDTGIISLNKPASQLSTRHVMLDVTVRDSGTTPRNATMKVKVTIEDVNDHTPIFAHNVYSLAVMESRPVNDIIITFNATDSDDGRNGELVYRIVRGNEENRFGIFPDGTLFIAHALDREARDMYSLVVEVRDCGDVPRRSTANTTIYILDANDNRPAFSNASYTFSVAENRPADTFVGSVKASDSDVGQNAELLYSLLDGNANFSLDPISGALYTRRPFDREYVMDTSSVQFYVMDVLATDGGSPRQRGKATVRVIITDVNDNPPLFARSLFSASVAENAAVDMRVIKMTATDADIGENGKVRYAITDGNVGGVFSIVETSGDITVNGPLDRETLDHYLLTVVATDTGLGQQLSSSTQVSITVTDFNDQVPRFTSSIRHISVDETTPIGQLLTVFTGVDLDLGNNAKLYYSFLTGNEDGAFKLDGYTGKMYLLQPLDYETKREYNLNVSVSDEGYRPSLSSHIFFKVNVMDANDNAPRFMDGFKSINVAEDTLHAQIARLRAVDQDSGSFGAVRFAIVSQDPNEGVFRIGSVSGEISVISPLDRETTDHYKLVITATDQAQPPALRLTSQKSLTIVIDDVNDNAPVWTSPPAFVVAAGRQQGQRVAVVVAEDADTNERGQVSYSLLSTTSLFSLHASSGHLTLLKDLPPTPLIYALHLVATDNGAGLNGRRSTESTITLLLSSSEPGPSFRGDPYTGNISESDSAGTTVFTVSASPSRSGVSVEYYLTGVVSQGVPRGGVVSVDAVTGVVTTAQSLDREVLGSTVTVEVTAVEKGGVGTPRTTTTEATVTLNDVNDTPPRFSPSVYNVTFPEDETNDPVVVRVGVTDPDITGRLTLRLHGDGADRFRVQNDGTLTAVSLPLDREERDRYRLTVTADDGVHTASATLTITITDTNDNSPIFTHHPYYFQIREDTDIGATVARVSATDDDVGDNAHVTYDVMSTWATDLFQLDSVLGTFTLIGGLDYELRQVYTLGVGVSDGGSPPRRGDTLVYMNVIDVNDNQPVFDPASFQQHLSEDVPPGTLVLNVSATDVDSGPNGEVRYSLLGDSSQHFTVDTVTGTIMTSQPLDRETRATYRLLVMATDLAELPDLPHSATATVMVTLRDVNDCYPQFTSPNVTSVKEETANGSVVFTVSATDLDLGVNSEVTFTLDPLAGDVNYPFVLDPDTGQLRVNSVLRRDVRSTYTLTITARDGGSPPLTSRQTLTITVDDVNNHPPVFTATTYRHTVAENVAVGSSLLKVQASDVDEGLNGVVRYFIVSGDDSYDLALDVASGVLRLHKQLDYERLQEYHIIIRAQDSGVDRTLAATATVIITVTDVNDFQPVFDDSPYVAYVQEGRKVGEVVEVVRVAARDEDSPVNSRLAYQLRDVGQQGEVGLFAMDQLAGTVTALAPLDRETVPYYTLTIIATDSGIPRLTGTGTLTVFVKDVNDHSPQFPSSAPYVGHVRENGGTGQSVITVTATDLDEGINAQITYELADTQDGRFAVSPTTGEVITTRSLDREQHSQFNLVVIATDHGIPPMSSLCDVKVHVDDVNDNTPTFERASYSQTIGDPTNSGQFVVGVTAVDRDSGRNGQVTYALLTSDSRVQIDQHTGVVTAARRLSGQDASFVFQVRASDRGTPALNSTVWVTITSHSVTGSPPVFSPPTTSLQVREDCDVGTVVTRVNATSSRSAVIYSIAGGNTNSALQIDKDNGTLTVSGKLDYEVVTSLTVWIQATDTSPDPLSAHLQLNITVLDANDNWPRFDPSYYHAHLVENSPLATSVLQVSASDLDSGLNGAVRYVMVSGNDNTTFTINSTSGLIRTLNPVVDREGIAEYHLIIQARDLGSPSLTSTCTVRIEIVDRNDNPPVFSGLFSMAVPEDLPLHSLVLTLTSTDRDTPANARATYALIPGPDSAPFAVDAVSGNVTCIGPLDAEVKERYRPEVSVSDSSYAAKTQVTIRLLDVNDNAPQFLRSSYAFEIREGVAPGTLVGRLTASDRDISSPNNEFYFSLKRPSTLFELQAETGELRTLRTMEYQRSLFGASPVNTQRLEVVVTDLGMPSLSSQARVTITITDANNHPPVFHHSLYMSAVPQNAGVGLSVLTVEASDDLDFGLNAEVRFAVSGGNGSLYFTVHADTGVVSVDRDLTGKQGRDYTLVVMATDRGLPPQSSSATVVLSVTDENRHTPHFTNTVFSKSVLEDVAIGYTIDTLRATDRDTGLNGQVRFSITYGNEKGLFHLQPVTGSLTVAGTLDYETERRHSLNITAQDLGLLSHAATRVFTVELVDVNDNSPDFNHSTFSTFVAENSPSGTTIFTLQAYDADSGNYAVVKYAFTADSQHRSLFSIHQDWGSVRVEGELDYEQRDLYVLKVMAYNPGSVPLRKSEAELRVYVTGVNEFHPEFLQKEYRQTISESAAMNSSIVTLQARDGDKGVDGVVYYYLLGASNLKGFDLHPLTGELTVVQRPDYESSPHIVLKALAKNWGSLHGNDTDTCTVTITVQDANDPPVFNKDQYVASVEEESPARTLVTTVTATDHDLLPQNRVFVYSIAAGNRGTWFSIDGQSGRIETTGNGVLDRETLAQYTLTVIAVDSGQPPQTGTCEVVIYLLDINDNGPVFVPRDLTVSVREGQPAGTHVITLSRNTSDPDLSPNQGPYIYQPLSSPAFRFFHIANTSGEVTTTRVIHHDLNEQFHLPLLVSDSGGVDGRRMTSTLTLTVLVSDVNNSPPQPRPLTLRVTVLDTMTTVGVVADVRPIDSDLEGNYTCRIITGDTALFSIPKGCDLTMLQEPNQSSYSLLVAGLDGSFDEVNYTVTVKVTRFTSSVLRNAVAMCLADTNAASFLQSKYVALTSAMESLFGHSSKPFIISLRNVNSDLNVYMAVREGEGVVPRQLLGQKLREYRSLLESRADLDIRNATVQLCSINPCQNAGTCFTQVSLTPALLSHSSPHLVLTSATPDLIEACDCTPAYGGARCESAREPCGDSFCAHGGQCEDGVCACPVEWTGRYCGQDVDECVSQPCQSGGTCTNLPGSFRCHCAPDYHGALCQNRYHCVSAPCHNSATCVDELDSFTCLCPYGYHGELCQQSSWGFSEDSYLTLPPLTGFNSLVITGYIATVATDGLLVFHPFTFPDRTPGFLALQVVGGVVRFSFSHSEGSGAVRVEVNGTRVNTGHWYRLEGILHSTKSSLVVQKCEDDSKTCQPCDPTNRTCYNAVTFPTRQTGLQGVRLSVGGVEEFSSLLSWANEIHSASFTGCLHSLQANTRPLLHLPSSLAHRHITTTCPRSSATTLCESHTCGVGAGVGSGGECHDRWSQAECVCEEGYTGQHCQTERQPFSFGGGVSVTFTLREAYRRQQLLLAMSGRQRRRRRRSSGQSSVTLRVRVSNMSGVVFSAKTADSSCVVWMETGAVKVALSSGQPLIVPGNLTQSWHTLSLTTTANNNITITIDHHPKYSQSALLDAVFPFDSLDVDSLHVGGATTLPNGRRLDGFEGCLSDFRVNGDRLPLNGSSNRYEVAVRGEMGRGCRAVCDNNPCGTGFSCRPEGELYNCSALAVAAQQESLQTGIIVVIVLSILLVIIIVVLFVLFRVRRAWFQRCVPMKKDREDAGKVVGGKSFDNDCGGGGGGSRNSPRYADNAQLEEMIIRNHIAEELGGQKTTSLSIHPDLIGSNLSSFHDGTMIIENLDRGREVGLDGDCIPEHYDLENASSIAPSDSDIIQHYQRFRHGKDLKGHLHHHQAGRDRFKPASAQLLKDGLRARQSPVSVGSALSVPSRPSPLAGVHADMDRHSPRTAPSPLSPFTSHSQGSNSAHSLGSHHSHSSSSSTPTTAPLNGHGPRPPPTAGPGTRYTRGLTVDEVIRLNARADPKNNASMLEAVSSSNEDPNPSPSVPHHHPHHHPNTVHRLGPQAAGDTIVLDPPDSSDSDSGANDSFTCSEFEYENEKGGRLDTPSAIMFSKLAEVDEDSLAPGPHLPRNDQNSNGDSAGSSNTWEDEEVVDGGGGGGALELDSLLNLGPHFDKLVGVFKDLALLPDTGRPLHEINTTELEEYV